MYYNKDKIRETRNERGENEMRLTEYRKKAGMDQKDIAEKLGIAVQTVSSWETEARRPNIDMLVKLAKIFDCTTDELLGYEKRQETREEIIARRMTEAREGSEA